MMLPIGRILTQVHTLPQPVGCTHERTELSRDHERRLQIKTMLNGGLRWRVGPCEKLKVAEASDDKMGNNSKSTPIATLGRAKICIGSSGRSRIQQDNGFWTVGLP